MGTTSIKPGRTASGAVNGKITPPPSGSGWMGHQLDEVVAAFREVLPDCGLKLVVPPPLPDGSRSRVSLSAWRRGETRADVHSAATASEAIAMMLATERAGRREILSRKGCPRCRGVGWYVGTGGATLMCVHANAQG